MWHGVLGAWCANRANRQEFEPARRLTMPSGGTWLLVAPAEIGSKSDGPALGSGWVHELADGREDGGDRLVVDGELFLDARLELIETAGEFLVRGQELAQLHEGANDVDAHSDGARGVEDISGLDGAMLGEGPRELAAATPDGCCYRKLR